MEEIEKMIEVAAYSDVCDNYEVNRDCKTEMGMAQFTAHAMIGSFKEGALFMLEHMKQKENTKIDTETG